MGDVVTLYPGEAGRVEMWPGRLESAEAFLARVGKYVEAVLSGRFRATYRRKKRGASAGSGEMSGMLSAKTEFMIDGRWKRAGAILAGTPGAERITTHFEPY
jgi:hypothetical protein